MVAAKLTKLLGLILKVASDKEKQSRSRQFKDAKQQSLAKAAWVEIESWERHKKAWPLWAGHRRERQSLAKASQAEIERELQRKAEPLWASHRHEQQSLAKVARVEVESSKCQRKAEATRCLSGSGGQSVIETVPLGTYSEKALIETKEPLIKAAQGKDGLSGALDSSVVTRKKKGCSPISKKGFQAHRSETLTGGKAASDLYNTTATLGTEAVQYVPPKLMGGDKETERGRKPLDWAKDSGDKFYSLTEESDLTSGEHSLSESGSSMSSETGNISSSNEPTVRQLRWQRKCTKMRSGPLEGTELSTSSGSKTLKWDYSGIRLTEITIANGQQMANNNMEGSTGGPTSSACTVGTDSGMLQSIYNSIKQLQTESRIKNRRTRVATKRLQGTVCKVAKSCTDIETKLSSMEERIAAFEVDVDALREQCVMQDGQLTDIMWKLEDYENRLRRNNLCFLGIDEGLEGNDIRAYMIKLIRGAFPELANWDWETEVTEHVCHRAREAGPTETEPCHKNHQIQHMCRSGDELR
ncbi:hypothetical protein NDU88_003823 [Pleurodeles waltl]|uniref:Uncharacterized protein n=1 Tax=Pleurodeles waltl TaxID=8319 RepID=A0AAV7LJP0_PLEWA|nr:hypothetical protein NDU88_003823 [Pleurodeles waltl]